MKVASGIWLPDAEIHLVDILARSQQVDGKGTYQYRKFLEAMRHVRSWRIAIDVGAHVGLWTMHLMQKFDRVLAIEPCKEHCQCFFSNIPPTPRVHLINAALGNKHGMVSLAYEEGSSGGTHIAENGVGDVHVVPLDDFALAAVDFIKIDVEGYELFVVQGAERTIKQWKPVILIEQKPKGLAERYGQKRMAAVDLLVGWGARVRFEMSGDYCLTFGA